MSTESQSRDDVSVFLLLVAGQGCVVIFVKPVVDSLKMTHSKPKTQTYMPNSVPSSSRL